MDIPCINWGFPGGSDDRESACNVEDVGLIPGLGRSPGGEHGNQFQYSCLENAHSRRAWWDTVPEVKKSQTWLSDSTQYTIKLIEGEVWYSTDMGASFCHGHRVQPDVSKMSCIPSGTPM